jgi:hypothetical protein
MSATAIRDCTCLGHLGRQDTDRIISIFVASPRVARVSTVTFAIVGIMSNKCHQCTRALMKLIEKLGNKLKLYQIVLKGRIFSCVRPFYERAVGNLDRSMHRSLWV